MAQPADLDDDQLEFAFHRLVTERRTAGSVRRQVIDHVLDRVLAEKATRMHAAKALTP